jgi:hypothetical protein
METVPEASPASEALFVTQFKPLHCSLSVKPGKHKIQKKRFSTAQSEYSSTFMFPLPSYLIETDTS